MGTTLTAALVEGDEVVVRPRRRQPRLPLRDGELRLLTSDHSLVEELRRQGRLTDEQAEDHPQRSIITRALGPEPEVEVDTLTFSARPGDVFLLCSDGLTTMVKDDGIAAILADSASLDEAVDAARRARPTRPAAATTSPSSPSGSRRPSDEAAPTRARPWSARAPRRPGSAARARPGRGRATRGDRATRRRAPPPASAAAGAPAAKVLVGAR